MKIQFYKTETTYQGKLYKILTPVSPLTEIYVASSRRTACLFGNKADYIKLAALFTLLTEVKDMIIYLPTGKNHDDYLRHAWLEVPHFSDVVICHHRTQLKRGTFKQLKQRLSKKNLVSFKIEHMKFADLTFDEKFWHKENKDLLDFDLQNDTLFLVGSAKIFKHLAWECLKFRVGVSDPPYMSHTHLYAYMRNGVAVDEDAQFCFYDKIWWKKWLDGQEEG